MNKTELIEKISEGAELSKASAGRALDSLIQAVTDELAAGGNVSLVGFGTYKVAKRKARIGRNPRTGEQIQIAASQKVKFLPAKALKEIFNR